MADVLPKTMRELAELYAGLKVCNKHTYDMVIRSGRLFDERTNFPHLEEIGLLTMQRWKRETLRLSKPVTYNGYLKYLRIISRWGVDQGYLSKNWFEELKPAPTPKVTPKALSLSVFYRAIAFLRENPAVFEPAWFWIIVIRTFFYTGIRRRQLISLVWGDIDFENKTLRCAWYGSKNLREWDIPMDESLLPDLKHLLTESERMLSRRVLPKDPVFNIYLFNKRYKYPIDRKGHMTGDQITKFYTKLSCELGERIGAHATRHTFATELCNPTDGSDPDLFAVQRLLGHTNLNTTRGYVWTPITGMRKAVSKLPEI